MLNVDSSERGEKKGRGERRDWTFGRGNELVLEDSRDVDLKTDRT
jgi:hypothetical protein